MGKTSVLREQKKNPVKRRIEVLEKTVSEGINRLLEDNQNLYGNDRVLSEALEGLDNNIMALKMALIEAGVITDAAFKTQLGRVEALRKSEQEERDKAAALEKLQQPEETSVGSELLQIHERGASRS